MSFSCPLVFKILPYIGNYELNMENACRDGYSFIHTFDFPSNFDIMIDILVSVIR